MSEALKVVGISIVSAVLMLLVGLILILVFARPNDRSDQITTASGLPNFHRVDSYLFRGAAPMPSGLPALKKMGVKTIIDFRVNPEMVQAERKQAQSLGMHYINLPIRRCNVKRYFLRRLVRRR
jgi:hypothetical protein